MKSGKEKGANGKPRAMAQIIAIALSKATPKDHETKRENAIDKKLGVKEKKNESSEYASIKVKRK